MGSLALPLLKFPKDISSFGEAGTAIWSYRCTGWASWDTLQGGEVSSLPSSSGAAGNVVLFAATWGRSLTARQRELKTSSLWTVAAFPWASLLPPLWLQLQPPLSGPPPPPGLFSSSRQSFLGTSAAIAKHPTQAAVFWPSRSWQLCFTSTWGG